MNEINDLYDDLQRQKKSAEMRATASDLSAASAESMSSLAAAVGGANAFGSAYFPARKRLAIRANVGGTHRVAFTPEATCWPQPGMIGPWHCLAPGLGTRRVLND